MTEKNGPKFNTKITSNSKHFRHAARASPLSGRHIPNQYASPLDTKHLMTPAEFHSQFIQGKTGNRYTDDEDIVEIPEGVRGNSLERTSSPSTPVTATSVTATQRSETATSLGGSTVIDNDEQAPTGWYASPRYNWKTILI